MISAFGVITLASGWLACAAGAAPDNPRQIDPAEKQAHRIAEARRFTVVDGTVAFEFTEEVLDSLGLLFVPRGHVVEEGEAEISLGQTYIEFELDSPSTLAVESPNGRFARLATGRLTTCGAMLVRVPGTGGRVVLGNLALDVAADGAIFVSSTLGSTDEAGPAFELTAVAIEVDRAQAELWLTGELTVTAEWAEEVDLPEAAGVAIGQVIIHADIAARGSREAVPGACMAGIDGMNNTAGYVPSEGPDVLIGDLQSVIRYGRVGDITGYSIGTNACNIGDERASWIASSNMHPVIFTSAYRVNDHGFQQIGMSWVKHGFYAVSNSLCSPCLDPVNGGQQLGVGCSDPYSSYLNGQQDNMSWRNDVNGHTGFFPYPFDRTYEPTPIHKRLQIHDADLDPDQNPGARYFIDGHYVTQDDAAAGNSDNNASYREVRVTENEGNVYALIIDVFGWPTQRGQAAVRAWQDVDPTVVETDVRVPGEGLFILAAKAEQLGTGSWRYIYALQNLNSDRSGQFFQVQLPEGIVVPPESIGFRDVDYHSGEIYDLTDWTPVLEPGYLTWSTDPYDLDPNANALRFSTVYTFWFDCNVEPGSSKITLGLFKPGAPTEVTATTIGPLLELIDCNENGIHDSCDIDCAGSGCEQPCGISDDCNSNGVPDECEPDCNKNGIADRCDIADCPLGDLSCSDCNVNFVPDGCEADCDGDGIPDACDTPEDTDGDGITDCFDLCPLTTPPNACLPPMYVTCLTESGFCLHNYLWFSCIEIGGMPMCPGLGADCRYWNPCPESMCRDGCLLGDNDGDGDLDLRDIAVLQRCFSGMKEDPAYVPPLAECSIPLDFDDDEDVDLLDHRVFEEQVTGPE